MTLLERRLSKLEASIASEAQPGAGKIIAVCRYPGEDRDAAIERHLAARPQDRGAEIRIFYLRTMLGRTDDEEGV